MLIVGLEIHERKKQSMGLSSEIVRGGNHSQIREIMPAGRFPECAAALWHGDMGREAHRDSSEYADDGIGKHAN